MNETQKPKTELRQLFLREFMKAIISNIKPAPLSEEYYKEEEPPEKSPTLLPKKSSPEPKEILEKSPIISSMQPYEVGRIVRIKKYPPNLMPAPKLLRQPKPKTIAPTSYVKSMLNTPITSTKQNINLKNLGKDYLVSLIKLNPLLADPSVQSVECPGPNKQVLVRKNNTIQTTKIVLTKEEISGILKEFSEKTKIPIIEGLFKAAYSNIIISAVSSDFIGTRFIIQKKNPFQPLVR